MRACDLDAWSRRSRSLAPSASNQPESGRREQHDDGVPYHDANGDGGCNRGWKSEYPEESTCEPEERHAEHEPKSQSQEEVAIDWLTE